MNPTLVVGASQGTGNILCRKLAENGHQVVALSRSTDTAEELDKLGVILIQGDATVESDVKNALEHTNTLGDAFNVVSTVCGKLPNGEFTDIIANRVLVQCCQEYTLSRFLLLTSIGCGDMLPFRSEAAIQAFGDFVEAKTLAENELRASQLPYSILRPGGLTDDPPTGQGLLCTDPEVHGFITRTDLSEMLIAVLQSDKAINQTYAAVDRERLRCINEVEAIEL